MADSALPVLIIPDIHEKHAKARSIRTALEGLVSHTVFLGDMFDDFKYRSEETVKLYNEWLHDKSITVLCGNHDLMYLAGRDKFWCSGYSQFTKHWIDQHLPVSMIDHFTSGRIQIATWVGEFLVSHAGLSQTRIDTDNELQQIQPILMQADHPARVWAHYLQERFVKCLTRILVWNQIHYADDALFAVDYLRGGRAAAGGPIWCDYRVLAPIGVKQIVGHTPDDIPNGRHLNTNDEIWCFDTHLRHVALVFDGNLVVGVPIPGAAAIASGSADTYDTFRSTVQRLTEDIHESKT
jgi:hypothetical protein